MHDYAALFGYWTKSAADEGHLSTVSTTAPKVLAIFSCAFPPSEILSFEQLPTGAAFLE